MDRKIYIVEDHEFVREMQARLIDLQPGLAVCGTAESVEDALEALPAGADLVLLDLSLFSGSGLDLLGVIRERWPELPCIVLSGKPAVEAEAAALAAGAVAYVEKGDVHALLDAIHSAPTTSHAP